LSKGNAYFPKGVVLWRRTIAGPKTAVALAQAA
jgi:hypothetical protein